MEDKYLQSILEAVKTIQSWPEQDRKHFEQDLMEVDGMLWGIINTAEEGPQS